MITETIEQIEARLIASLQANTSLYDPLNPVPERRGLTSTSAVAVWRNYLHTIAMQIFTLQQLMGIFEGEVEDLVALSPPGTPRWIQDKCFKFQYSATTPQIVQFDNATFTLVYPIINEALRIITQCAVVTNPNKVALVKVAKGGSSPAPLSTPEKDALISYLRHHDFAGIDILVSSLDPDFLMLGADITYDGQYSATIQADVTTAINNFITSFNVENFNGKILVSELEDVIQAVPGVIDVIMRQVEARPNASVPADATILVDNQDELISFYNTLAGYFIIDTDTGRDLASTLTFTIG